MASDWLKEYKHGLLLVETNLLQPVQWPDVVQGVNAGGETAVKTEDLTVHQSCEGQIVKQVGEILPHIGIAIFPETLVVEAVHLGDLSALVVSSQDGDAAAEPHLQRNTS